MGFSKTDSYEARLKRRAELAKALAHPARLAILEFVAMQSNCICGDIVDKLPLSQSTVSQHLKELKKSGLIQGNINGPKTCYCIDEKVWEEARQEFSMFFQSLKPSENCC